MPRKQKQDLKDWEASASQGSTLYRVPYVNLYHGSLEVRADSPQEAEEKVLGSPGDFFDDNWELQVGDIDVGYIACLADGETEQINA
jgi:hypothetical protein